jgi:hypothetical protein
MNSCRLGESGAPPGVNHSNEQTASLPPIAFRLARIASRSFMIAGNWRGKYGLSGFGSSWSTSPGHSRR